MNRKRSVQCRRTAQRAEELTFAQDDWRAQDPASTVTKADVDQNYQNIINGMQNGTYANRGAVMLAHQSSTCLPFGPLLLFHPFPIHPRTSSPFALYPATRTFRATSASHPRSG